jgi:hypothetical protein
MNFVGKNEGGPKNRWEDNILINLKYMEGNDADCVHLG